MASRRRLPAGFVVPAQPIEIKHDGYRMLVRRDGGHVRLFSRKAIDWTNRLPAIAAGAGLLKAKSFDGEAVVVGHRE
jgi:bifunctional non-homologous end joining protein LigD